MTHPPALWSLASYTGVAALLFQPDPQFYVLCGVVITSAASIISLRISARNARDDAKNARDEAERRYSREKEEREERHKWEREDREAFRVSLKTDIKQVAAIAVETKQDIRADIAQAAGSIEAKLNPPSV